LFCVLQLHELRFAERSPIGGTKKKKDSALRPFKGLVRLFMAELIGQSKCRSLLTDLQANRRRNRLMGGRAFLRAGKTKKSDKENDGNGNLHFGSKFRFVACRVRAGIPTSTQNICSEANSKVERIPLPTPFPHPPPERLPQF
jgi:hypothetical protein